MAKKSSTVDKLAKLRKKLEETDIGGSGGGGFFYPKEGRSTIRILPEVGEMEFFFQSVGRHYFGNDKDAPKVYCPSYTSEGDLPCPVCETRNLLYKQGKNGDKSAAELASQLNVRRAFWMNVIDRANEDAGPMIFTPGVTIMNSIAALVQDPDYGDITDVLEGTDIIIERSGTGLDTEYQVLPKRLPTPLSESDEQAEDWLDLARDLSYVEVSDDPAKDAELSAGHAIYVLPYDRVQAEFDAFFGLDDDDEDEEPEPVKPTRRRTTRTSRKSEPEPEPEPEDEDEDDEEVDDEDDEGDDVEQEIAQRKTRRVRRVRRR